MKYLKNRRTYRPKRCEYNNEDDDNCPNILSDKNDVVQIKIFHVFIYTEGRLRIISRTGLPFLPLFARFHLLLPDSVVFK